MKSQKILIAGLILMVVLNICTLGFIIFKSNHGFGHRMGGRHGGPGKFIGKRLGFTEQQEQELTILRETHEKKMCAIRTKTDSLRKQHFALMKAGSFDGAKSDQLAIEMGNVHAQREKEMANYFVSIKALCTKEQQEGYNEFIDRVSEHMPGSRRGGPGGLKCD
jgi:Spy/CpxP family protein refolding chaperone